MLLFRDSLFSTSLCQIAAIVVLKHCCIAEFEHTAICNRQHCWWFKWGHSSFQRQYDNGHMNNDSHVNILSKNKMKTRTKNGEKATKRKLTKLFFLWENDAINKNHQNHYWNILKYIKITAHGLSHGINWHQTPNHQ